MASSQIAFTKVTGSTGAIVLKKTTIDIISKWPLLFNSGLVLTALEVHSDMSEQLSSRRLADGVDLCFNLLLNIDFGIIVIFAIVGWMSHGLGVETFRKFVEHIAHLANACGFLVFVARHPDPTIAVLNVPNLMLAGVAIARNKPLLFGLSTCEQQDI